MQLGEPAGVPPEDGPEIQVPVEQEVDPAQRGPAYTRQ
jgi:hypothetical protein